VKETRALYLFTILGLNTVVALEVTLNYYPSYTTVGRILLTLITILFFLGLYGIIKGKLKKKLDNILFSKSSE